MKRAFTMRQLKAHDRREAHLVSLLGSQPSGEARMELLMLRQDWRDNGRWARYYQAREGRVHASRYCPALSETTALTAMWWFSGDPVEVVAGSGARLCRKCFPDIPGGAKKSAACPGSGELAACRCGDRGCRQVCPHCGQNVLITPSGVLRRHP